MFAVKPAIFDKWFVDRRYRQAALRWLYESDLLLVRKGAQLPKGEVIPTDTIVSFEKITRRGGKRENGRWLRFLDPTPVATKLPRPPWRVGCTRGARR